MRWLVVVVLLAVASPVRAGSYRGGTLGWQVHDLTSPRTVLFSVTTFWDEPATGATDVAIDFGDGTSSGPLASSVVYTGVTQYKGQAFTIRRATASHTYAGTGTSYAAVVAGCCRRATSNAAATDAYRLAATVTFGVGSYGNPVMLVVDAQLPASTGANDESSVALAEETWWGGHIAGGHIATLSESGVASPALTKLITNTYGSYLAMTGLMTALLGTEYTVSVVRDDLGGSSTMLDFVIETVPYVYLYPYCLIEKYDTPIGSQPGSTVTRMITQWPSDGVLELIDPVATATLATALSWTPTVSDAGSYGLAYVRITKNTDSRSCFIGVHVPLSEAACEDGLGAACGTHTTCANTDYGFACACDHGYEQQDAFTCGSGCHVQPITCGFDHGFPVGLTCCTDPASPDGYTCTCNIGPQTPPTPPDDPTPDPTTDPDDNGGCSAAAPHGLLLLLALAPLRRRRRRCRRRR